MLMGGDRGHWYVSRREIDENSPSRHDGINLKKETYLRKSYCTFLRDLGMRLKVPQATIATSTVFCHRFFLHQSHAKNDRMIIATVCMFLAGKVEETPRTLKDVIQVSYSIIHKNDPGAAQRIKQKDIYEQQKELILLGEPVVLSTLAFDFNVQHPYKPLVEGIKKLKIAQNELARVAWNFVNDGFRTSLCLQYKPRQIAAGAIFLAAKYKKIKLPSEGDKFWWQEFDVTSQQLEDVSNQILEVYDQNKIVQGSEHKGISGSVHNQHDPIEATTGNDASVISSGPYPAVAGLVSSSGKPVASKHTTFRSGTYHTENYKAAFKSPSNDDRISAMSVITDHMSGVETKDNCHSEFSKKDTAGHAEMME